MLLGGSAPAIVSFNGLSAKWLELAHSYYNGPFEAYPSVEEFVPPPVGGGTSSQTISGATKRIVTILEHEWIRTTLSQPKVQPNLTART